MHPVSRESFADLVAAAIAALPDELRQRLDHVQFSIEDEPSPEDYRLNDVPDDEDLFGLLTASASSSGPTRKSAIPSKNCAMKSSAPSTTRSLTTSGSTTTASRKSAPIDQLHQKPGSPLKKPESPSRNPPPAPAAPAQAPPDH
jgi:hypothetical protein